MVAAMMFLLPVLPDVPSLNICYLRGENCFGS
ncbi:unnamed protein product [Gulo gulo]|uniref:Uncharacterized protein n=1 Tax=Gulo gulo TaxID=48420 RepID=A0A9X9LEA6_GULGU|nr:unnamed protein product [Gulo gulo]